MVEAAIYKNGSFTLVALRNLTMRVLLLKQQSLAIYRCGAIGRRTRFKIGIPVGSNPTICTTSCCVQLSWQSAGLWPRRSAVQVRSRTPYGTLAQLVERQVEALRVPGSSPGGPTIHIRPRHGHFQNRLRAICCHWVVSPFSSRKYPLFLPVFS